MSKNTVETKQYTTTVHELVVRSCMLASVCDREFALLFQGWLSTGKKKNMSLQGFRLLREKKVTSSTDVGGRNPLPRVTSASPPPFRVFF